MWHSKGIIQQHILIENKSWESLPYYLLQPTTNKINKANWNVHILVDYYFEMLLLNKKYLFKLELYGIFCKDLEWSLKAWVKVLLIKESEK